MDVFASSMDSPTAGGWVALGQEGAGTPGSASGVSWHDSGIPCPCSAW